jgi:glycosyltransferase involved in cell wall biosynthesis
VYSELDPVQGGASGQRHFRGATVQRAIKSILAQQFKDWELIIVDDGCCDYPKSEDGEPIEGSIPITSRILGAFEDMDERIRYIHIPNGNRAIARNTGMDAATGEWICWLDSDDEYSTHYLRELDKAIQDFPEYSIFNFGSIIHWADHRTTIRETFRPAEEGKGHEWFRSGQIGTGSFIFKRDLWASDKKYRIPDEPNPYQFAADSKFPLKLDPVADKFQYENTENPDGAFQDGVKRHGLSLGNPWGDDALAFYLLTRDNKSKPLGALLYIQYPRSDEDGKYNCFGEVFDTKIDTNRKSG